MDTNAANIIDLCIDGNAAELQAALDDVMRSKLNDALVAKRIEFAQSIFNKSTATEEQDG